MFTWGFPYRSQRMPVLAKNVVATSQPLAAQAGLAMLAKGGNAVDAGLAAAITLTVAAPVTVRDDTPAIVRIWVGWFRVTLTLTWSPASPSSPATRSRIAARCGPTLGASAMIVRSSSVTSVAISTMTCFDGSSPVISRSIQTSTPPPYGATVASRLLPGRAVR